MIGFLFFSTMALGLFVKTLRELQILSTVTSNVGLLTSGLQGLQAMSASVTAGFVALATKLGLTSLALAGWIALIVGALAGAVIAFNHFKKSTDNVTKAYDSLNKIKKETAIIDQQMQSFHCEICQHLIRKC